MEKLDKIAKKLYFCLYIHFLSLFFASVIAKMIAKKEKIITITRKCQTAGKWSLPEFKRVFKLRISMREILQDNITG